MRVDTISPLWPGRQFFALLNSEVDLAIDTRYVSDEPGGSANFPLALTNDHLLWR
ncbi:MAG TPA: hypothetical protein VF574_09000 [Allosphingosinicella sp.]|jgi:hypothetical protein